MSGRILIVDDNSLNVKLLAARLSREYYAVSTAANGADAIASAQQDPPDLILLDVMMPDMDGFETCRRLRADVRTCHVPVVMVTALSDIDDRIKGLKAGAQDFLSKPVNDLALLARVRAQLRLKLVMDEWRLRQTSGDGGGGMADRSDAAVDSGKPRILLVCDAPAECSQIGRALAPMQAQLTIVADPEAARSAAMGEDYDMAIGSLALQHHDGLKICPALRGQEQTRHLPILLLGDPGDQELVARGLDLGANDYLLRPIDAIELTVRVANQVRFLRFYEQLKQGYETSLAMALTDALTGIFNRRYFDNHLPRLMRRCVETGKPLALLVIDVDHFKQINDRFGHAAGDAVLQALAARLLNNLRPLDFVSRYGGEEFAVVLPETDAPTAHMIAERLLHEVSKTGFTLPAPHPAPIVTISIGGAIMRHDDDPVRLFTRADQAVYAAKQAGRNRIAITV